MAKQKTLMTRIREIFSDKTTEEKPGRIHGHNSVYRGFNNKRIKMDYNLTRAIYFGQSYSKDYDFTLASAFGKPIVNGTASFIVGNTPSVVLNPKETILGELLLTDANDLAYGEEKLNGWIHEHDYLIYNAVAHCMKDGDSYLLIEDPEKPERLDPREVTAIFDTDTGEHVGWMLTREVILEQSDISSNFDKKIIYEYRYYKKAPYKTVTLRTEKNPDGVIIYVEDPLGTDERPLAIVAWNNELEPGKIFGNSEYRNVLFPMARYSEVLEKAIINNTTASMPIPYAKGIQDMDTFLAQYATENEDGTHTINLNGEQFVVDSGEHFALGVNTIPDTTTGSAKLLEILFYLICQGSETPEFLMGASVNSSHASVDTQLQIPVKKAKRKQSEFKGFLKQTMEAVAYAMRIDPKFPIQYDLEAMWGDILDEDDKIVVEIADRLLEKGIITNETYAKIIGTKVLDKYVDDIEEEMDKAKQESLDRAREFDVYNQNTDDEDNPIDNKAGSNGKPGNNASANTNNGGSDN